MMEEQGMELVGVIEAGTFLRHVFRENGLNCGQKFFLGTVGYLIACTRKY